MSKSKPSAGATKKRRDLVRSIVFDRGVTSPEGIRKILEGEFGVVVNRQTVGNDFKLVAGGLKVEKVEEFQVDLLGIYRNLIGELTGMIDVMVDVMKKAALMKIQSQIMKDRSVVANNLAEIKDGRWVGGKMVKKGDGDLVVRFEFE